MKIIDLLNKIANREEVPEKIIYKGKTYYAEFNSGSEMYYYCDDEDNLLLENIDSVNQLDEIIEEDKKIRKITMRAGLVGSIKNKLDNLDINVMAVEDKINEIIDYLEKENK